MSDDITLMDVLLGTSKDCLSNEQRGTYEVKRLSAKLGVPFVLQLRSIDPERYSDIQKSCVAFKGDGITPEIQMHKLKMLTLVEGVTNEEFTNRDFLKKNGWATPKDALGYMLNAGEIDAVSGEISKLSGFDNKAEKKIVEEVKN